jgi:pimeloyl-ACP methyl ester carboxylesterase
MTDYAFLHGGGQGGWVWDETIAALRRQTDGAFGRALALDVPGCGTKRDRGQEALDCRAIAAELVGEIAAAGLRDVVLVGHSAAGKVLPFMLEAAGDLFGRVIYVSCLALAAGQASLDAFGSGLHGEDPERIGWPLDPATPDRDAFFRAMFCNDMDEAQARALLDRLGDDAWPAPTATETAWRYDHLGGTPATYVLCLQDQALPAPWQEVFARRLRASRTVRIDAGHQVMNTRPHALAELLRLEASRRS